MEITQLSVQIDTDEPNTIYLFAHDGGPQEVGMLRIGTEEKGCGWISMCFVAEPQRGKGIGKALLSKSFDICREMGKAFVSLSVADKNEGAQRLYKSLGFIPFMTGQEGYMQYIKQL